MNKKELLCVYSGLALNGLLVRNIKSYPLRELPPLAVELAKSLIHELEKENDREDRPE